MNKLFIDRSRIKKIITVLAPFAFYTVIFLVLTYPLVFNFSSAIAGATDSDAPVFFWNAWQLEKQIMEKDFGLSTNDLLFPTNPSLITHTYTQLQSIIVAFFNIFFNNLVLSFNLVFLLFSVLSAYFAYKFFYLLTSHKLASILAGQLFAFQAMWSIYVMFGTQNLLSIWFLPCTLFLYELYRKKRKARFGIIGGIVLGLSLVNGFYPFAFTFVGIIIYSLLRLVFSNKRSLLQYLKGVIYFVMGFIVSAGWKIVILFQNIDYSSSLSIPSVSHVDFYHADFMNILRPVQFHPWWGVWSNWFRDISITNGNSFIGFTVIGIILLFITLIFVKKAKVDEKKLILLFALGYFLVLLLSFGPILHFFGYNTGIYMPHYLLQKIFTQINNLRVPMRWLLMGQIFFAGMVMYFIRYIFNQTNKSFQKVLFTIISIGFLIDVAYLPRQIIPIHDSSTEAYRQIENNEKGTVLNIPIEINNGFFTVGETSCMSMVYQTIHGNPIIGGRLSRMEENIKDYSEFPIMKYLLAPKENSPDIDDTNLENISYFDSTYQIKYISIDKNYIDIESLSGQQLVNYLGDQLKFSNKLFEDSYFLVLTK